MAGSLLLHRWRTSEWAGRHIHGQPSLGVASARKVPSPVRASIAVETPPAAPPPKGRQGGGARPQRRARITQANKDKPLSNKLWWLKNEDVDVSNEKVTKQVNRMIQRSSTVKEALQVVEEMKAAGLPANEGTYLALITVCRKQKQGERALVVYEAMKAAGVKPELLTFNTLIGCCSQAQLLEDAFRIKDDMVAAGYKPDVVTYTSLMAVCAKTGPYRGRASPAQRLNKALGVYREMKSNEITPDTITFNTLLYAAAAAKEPQKVFEVYAMMARENVTPNYNTFQLLLESTSQSGRLQKAEEVLGEMKAAGIKAKVEIFNMLINACGKAPQPQVDKAFAYFEEMKSTTDALPNAETYDALITAACKGGDFDKAMQAYNELKGVEFTNVLTSATFNKLIHCAGRAGQIEQAFELFHTMAEAQCVPDVVTYCSLVSACGKVGDASRALAVSENMEALGVKPNQVVFHALMGACGRAAKWEEAVSLYRRMLLQCPGEPPDLGTYTILFDACFGPDGTEATVLREENLSLESKIVQTAIGLYGEGEEKGVLQSLNKDDLTRCDLRGLTRSTAVVAILTLLDRLKARPPVLDLVIVTGNDRGQRVKRVPRGVPRRPPKLLQIAEATLKAVGLSYKPLTTLTFQAVTVEAPELRRKYEA